ncbi:putative glutamyl-tRNA(Gln) amidotransferase subunit A [Venturia nashicola]|uniref:amidase n=1 Tax=Venturia nashicola TaxID=86259 RepID=A0A4Z1P010_9PEZI|nr:putative glutamyl-tRNA(Gln) amidotransferase subunit A [Venturia nashicola]
MSWQELAAKKRAAILAEIPKEWLLPSIPPVEEVKDVSGTYTHQFLDSKEIEITESDAETIVKNTTGGVWSCVDVCKAFCHRAAIAHQLTNCLHEIFFTAAIHDAEILDSKYASSKPLGPLHGLPISLKDQFHVRNVETSMGYIGWLGTFQGKPREPHHAEFESELVRELRQLGAILYVKTAVPHTLMCGETVNNIIGYTENPRNRYLSAGGSSGGEGALIGAKGSVVGFGTDIGGSIRIPAAFNGLYGLRPSAGRLPYEGMANSMDGQNSILSVVGPLGSTIGALRLVTKSLLKMEPWNHDPLVVEIPWRAEQEKLPEKLVFGVVRYDGVVGVTPPIRRALEITIDAVKKQGHEVIEWTPPPHSSLNTVLFKTWAYDSGHDCNTAFALSGEPIAPQMTPLFTSTTPQFTASQIAENNVAQREIKKQYLDYWNSTEAVTGTGRPVDAVICPTAPFPAARPNCYAYYGYTTWVNLLDYSSVVFPVTSVDKELDKVDEGYKPLNDEDKICYESYDPAIYDGAHVALQVVGRRFQEERILAIADVTSTALKAL